jgi:hypothetical protein
MSVTCRRNPMKTIPKTRRRSKVDGPVYRELVAEMGFDPATVTSFEFGDWGLDDTYPPTVGELVGQLSRHAVPEQEYTDEGQGSLEASGGDEGLLQQELPDGS